jgi:hypothetical protein
MAPGEQDPSTSADDGEPDGDRTDAENGRDRDRSDIVLAVLLVATVVAAAGVFALGPPGGPSDDGVTGTPDAAAGTAAGTASSPSPSPSIGMNVRSIESCGTRCRLVTIALSNSGDDAARSVSVETEITTGDSLVWTGSGDVGRLGAGETVTRTRTIRVGYADAARIEANGGRIRIETVVHTAAGTRVFTERRTVS